ncbi:MAG TPA: YraN family protein [Anaerolineales bacterium]
MPNQKQVLGSWGEQRAADYLQKRGYELLGRNVRSEYGEIDLLARQGEVLVFVEVKARSTTRFGQPEEAITARKQQHLLDCALDYLQTHPELDGDWRVDVISVRRVKGGQPEILHFENALDG